MIRILLKLRSFDKEYCYSVSDKSFGKKYQMIYLKYICSRNTVSNNRPILPGQNPYLDMLKRLILKYSHGYSVKVYLFGSRAKNTAHKLSDIDIAILPIQ